MTILAEGGNLRRLRHHRQFLKYRGLDLAKSQSGQSKGHEVFSKRGNKRLRLAFWMAGLVAIRQRENLFRDKYERYLRATPFDANRKRKGADRRGRKDGPGRICDRQAWMRLPAVF